MAQEGSDVSKLAYDKFLSTKRIIDIDTGIESVPKLPSFLFDHQRDITSWALRRGRAAVFAGTGLGKTAIELVWADIVSNHTKKPVLIFAPLAVSKQHIREGAKFSIKADLVNENSSDRIQVTNYQKMDRFDLSKYGGVVIDECFAPETEIDCVDNKGEFTVKYIKDIRKGDRILNASGIDVVSDIHRREIHYAIKIKISGVDIITSPNHPLFTQRGWIGAQDLRPKDQIMETKSAVRMVRGGLYAKASQSDRSKILRSILLSEMANDTARNIGEGPFPRSSSEAWGQEISLVQVREARGSCRDRENKKTKSDGKPRNTKESIPPIERNRAQTFRAWGKWDRINSAATGHDGCTIERLDTGICFITGETKTGIPDLLQCGLGALREKNRNRGGWSFPQVKKSPGQEKNRDVKFYGVDSIEVLESGHHDLDKYRDTDGKLYFYDIGATRHPSYSISGLLVHNSSILKSTTGKYRTRLINECQQIPFRLAATATPAPNDFMELGNHSEFLGAMSYTDMLATFFVHDGGDTQKWRLKGHAGNEFWKWMASWAVMMRKPSDLGYSNEGYDLPPLMQNQHLVSVNYVPSMDTGMLFPMHAQTLQERISARRASVGDRVKLAASITPNDRPYVWWCNLNAESELLVKSIPDAVEVRGSDKDAIKEQKLDGFSNGKIRVLVTKPSISGFGMNWQHCANTGFVGLNDSFEQVYQAIRRFWRFGQTQSVSVDFISAETEGAVIQNLRRKEADADRMAAAMILHMADITKKNIGGQVRSVANYQPTINMELPEFVREK